MRDICIFIVKLYIQQWFECTNALKAPNQDLNFLRKAVEYKNIDKVVSEAVCNKMQNHLWYLMPETVALDFFDSNVSIETKKKMVNRLKARDPIFSFVEYRKTTNVELLLQHDLSDFVSHKTKIFFTNFDICTDFFDHDNEDYYPHGKTTKII